MVHYYILMVNLCWALSCSTPLILPHPVWFSGVLVGLVVLGLPLLRVVLVLLRLVRPPLLLLLVLSVPLLLVGFVAVVLPLLLLGLVFLFLC